MRSHERNRSHPAPRIPVRPEIDGLRAVAIGAVLLFHADLGAPGGFTGVDVFFVISGFLITSLIVADLKADSFSMAAFWERRIRRIFPALLAMQAAVLLVGYWLYLPADLVPLAKSSAAQVVFGANIFAWRDTGYFAVAADFRPLLHGWSLAVEEQFYLVLPVVLPLIFRRGIQYVRVVLVAAFAVSLLLSVVGTWTRPGATFFLLPTRAWELLAGCLLALQPPDLLRKTVREWVSWAGMAAILTALVAFSTKTPFPGFAAILPVVGTGLVIAGNSPDRTAVGHMLSARPLVAIGRISYAAYLWHWPLLVWSRYVVDGELSLSLRLGVLAITTVLAIVSLVVVENPIRHRNVFPTRPAIMALFATGSAALLLASLWLWKTDGAPWRVPPSHRRDRVDVDALTLDRSEAAAGLLPVVGDRSSANPATFMVWGDSQALASASVFDRLAQQRHLRGYLAANGGSPPLPGVRVYWDASLPEWNERILEEIEHRRIGHVFLVARWAWYLNGATAHDIAVRGGDRVPPISDDTDPVRSQEAARRVFVRSLSETCRRLAAAGTRVYLVMQAPDQRFNPSRRAFLHVRTGGLLSKATERLTMDDYRERSRQTRDVFTALQDTIPFVTILDGVAALESQDGMLCVERDGVPLYLDDHHLSPYGASLFLEPHLKPIFDTMAENGGANVEEDRVE